MTYGLVILDENIKKSTILVAVLCIVGCGSGASDEIVNLDIPLEQVVVDSSDPIDSTMLEPLANAEEQVDSSPDPEVGEDSVPGQELVNGIPIDGFSTIDGVEVLITGYKVRINGLPEIELTLSNNSLATPVRNASCDVNAYEGEVVVDTAGVAFNGLFTIDPGDSTADTGSWLIFDDGFSSIDRIMVECVWISNSSSLNINGAVQVVFVEYTTSEVTGKPAVTLQITNNSSNTIRFAQCGVEAKRGDFIVANATVDFAASGNSPLINSGEALQATGEWNIDSFDQFYSEPFNPDNLNCNWFG